MNSAGDGDCDQVTSLRSPATVCARRNSSRATTATTVNEVVVVCRSVGPRRATVYALSPLTAVARRLSSPTTTTVSQSSAAVSVRVSPPPPSGLRFRSLCLSVCLSVTSCG